MNIEINKNLVEAIKMAKEVQALVPEPIRAAMDMHKPMIDLLKTMSPIQTTFQKLTDGIKNNPEFNFLRLIDNSNISEEEISKRLLTVEENVVPILEVLNVSHIWVGANFALSTDTKINPERIRHFFISTRTIIEYLIDTLLAPEEKVKVWEKYPELLQNYKEKHSRQAFEKIPRAIRIKYFCSKIQFGLIEEFTEKEIQFINKQYKEVCKIHTPNIIIEQKDIDLIRLHTGTTIWLLGKLYLLIEGKE